ncbi:MAG: GSCFA domain-containing protein, partial [Winogradskyella sp.]
IQFHPVAIERLITDAINQKKFAEEDIFFQNEQWHCFDAHSKFSNSDKNHLLSQLNNSISITHKFLSEAKHIVITLGTAWVYRFIENDKFVANCHKVPQKKFLKELLSVEQITESLDAIISLVKSVNPDVNFIFTVSPVRHVKDGFVENTLSKAHLITAIHNLLSLRREPRNLNYFPSYEIMMDELRDYRFYNEDMLHPNQTAVNYIWEKFRKVCISVGANQLMDEVEIIQKGLAHKPFNPESESHKKFVLKLKKQQKNISIKYSHITF